jgi:hypothetical protein
MTLVQLIKKLEKLRAKHGNAKVCADADAIELGTGNHTWSIVNLKDVRFSHVRQVDEDGDAKCGSGGYEITKPCIILS